MFCPECGSKNTDDAAFCENCGTKLVSLEAEKGINTQVVTQFQKAPSLHF